MLLDEAPRKLREDRDQLLGQRNELLDALELIARYSEPTAVNAEMMQKIARAAIAKASTKEIK